MTSPRKDPGRPGHTRRPDGHYRPLRGVTRDQQRTIGAIVCLTLLRGRPPLLRELAEAWGVSKWGAACRLHWLEKKGLWRKSDRSLTELGLRSALGPSYPPRQVILPWNSGPDAVTLPGDASPAIRRR